MKINVNAFVIFAAVITSSFGNLHLANANCGEIPGVPTIGETCGGYAASFVDSNGSTSPTTATAIVTNDEDNIYVDVNSTYDSATGTGYLIQAVSVYVSEVDPEVADAVYDNHQPDYSKFQALAWIDAGTSSYQSTISLSSIGVTFEPAKRLYFMVYARILTYSNWTLTNNQDLYAYGAGFTEYPCGGGYFEYNLCSGDSSIGCTYTQGYWKNHSSQSKVAGNKIPWPVVDTADSMDENDTLCVGDSRTLMTLMKTSPKRGDAYLILAHQYIAARLNVADGASVTDEVSVALAEAEILIEDNCGKTVRSSTDTGGLMLIYAGILDTYNNGDIGPGHCE